MLTKGTEKMSQKAQNSNTSGDLYKQRHEYYT